MPLWKLIGIMIDRRFAPLCTLCILMSILYGVCYVVFTDELSTLQDAIINNESDRRVQSMFMVHADVDYCGRCPGRRHDSLYRRHAD